MAFSAGSFFSKALSTSIALSKSLFLRKCSALQISLRDTIVQIESIGNRGVHFTRNRLVVLLHGVDDPSVPCEPVLHVERWRTQLGRVRIKSVARFCLARISALSLRHGG